MTRFTKRPYTRRSDDKVHKETRVKKTIGIPPRGFGALCAFSKDWRLMPGIYQRCFRWLKFPFANHNIQIAFSELQLYHAVRGCFLYDFESKFPNMIGILSCTSVDC